MENKMKCSKCGSAIPTGKNFCVECGEHLPEVRKCVKCGAVIPSGKNFCMECGNPIGDMIGGDNSERTIVHVFVIIGLGAMMFGGIALMMIFPVWWGCLSGCVISGWCFAALLRALGLIKLPSETQRPL